MTSRILGASLFLTTALSLASLSRPRPFTPLLRRLSTLLPAVPPTPRRDPKGKILAGNDPTRPNNGPDVALMMDPPTVVPDPYSWMRSDDRTSKEVLHHLDDENDYTTSMTAHLGPLRDELYDEMLSFIQETDYTSPTKKGDYYYYSRTFAGLPYTTHYRAPLSSLPPNTSITWDGAADSEVLPGETVLLDVNMLAKGHDYCSTGSVTVSPSGQLLAYTVDNTGGETYNLVVVRIDDGSVVDTIEEIDSTVVWGKGDDVIYYLKMDAAHRPHQFYKHVIGGGEDKMLFEEKDELFWMGMCKSQDGKYLFVESGSKETSEANFISLEEEDGVMQCVAKRSPKCLYDVEHREGEWIITTNSGGLVNFCMMSAPALPDSKVSWELMKDQASKVMFDGGEVRCLDGVTPLKEHLVVWGREEGIPRVWVVGFGNTGHAAKKFNRVEFEEEAYDVGSGGNREYDTKTVMVSYDSLTTPLKTLKIDLDDLESKLVVKTKNVPGYDASKYACERRMVKSRDGTTMVPISMVYNKAMRKEGQPQHLHLYGYGSYGACMECYFSSARLPLLDRGIVYVIAHVRGGGEMGRQWYEEPNGAKYLCKKNTFNDFVDVAQYLQDEGVTSPELMSTEGRSAGGLLMGASINQKPELFKAAIFGVPFVDVTSTMVDCTIPLTVVEWEEWGNPNEKKYFEYMNSYSPVNNVKSGGKYPSVLLTGGLHDPRVQYWEPAKMAAELRHGGGEGSGPVLLKIDMAAGHFSASDRYKYYRELAFDWAFVLNEVGLADKGE